MRLSYSGRSAPSALAIADASTGEIEPVRSGRALINWGRNRANTRLNPDISNSTNKRVMRELFREHGVPMPKLLNDSELLVRLYDGRKVVGRPDHHMKGRGFWLIDSIGGLAKAKRGTRRKAAATHFMEFIDAPHEYRVHIFKGKSIRISEKGREYKLLSLRERGDGTALATLGFRMIKPTGPVKHVRRAAKIAVEALGLDFGAVDVLALDDGTPYVLEVNSSPGLGGSMPALWAETFKRWYKEEIC